MTLTVFLFLALIVVSAFNAVKFESFFAGFATFVFGGIAICSYLGIL